MIFGQPYGRKSATGIEDWNPRLRMESSGLRLLRLESAAKVAKVGISG